MGYRMMSNNQSLLQNKRKVAMSPGNTSRRKPRVKQYNKGLYNAAMYQRHIHL